MFWRKERVVKIEKSEISENALFALGFNYPKESESFTVVVDEESKVHLDKDLIGYSINLKTKIFRKVKNSYIWENK